MTRYLLCLLALPLLAARGSAQTVADPDRPGFADAFGLGPRATKTFSVRETAVRTPSGAGANVLWPGESAALTFRFANRTDTTIAAKGRFELIRYAVNAPPGAASGTPQFRALASHGETPFTIALPPRGEAEVAVSPAVPAFFGGYALVAEIEGQGRAFAAALVRVPKAAPGRVFAPTFALDLPGPPETSEAVLTLFRKLGVKGGRMEADYYPTTLPEHRNRMTQIARSLGWAQAQEVTLLLTVGAGSAPMPLGRPRPWLSPDGRMRDTRSDATWLPSLDRDFRRWTGEIVRRYGWPKGPVNAVELGNAPWEGMGRSGGGADPPRYRELYTQMARGVQDARQAAAAQVLIGAAGASSDTRDRLFGDGALSFLPWLDFVRLPGQPLAADPALERAWQERKEGPVQVWDTERGIADADERVAGRVAAMRAQGVSRAVGAFSGDIYTSEVLADQPRAGIAQAWAPAAAVAAVQQFLGPRAFQEILFKNGLPWVFAFQGRSGVDDGTLVALGDLGRLGPRDRVLFRQAQAALPETGGALTLPDYNGQFQLLDCYGNPVPATDGQLTVPLDGRAFFLRTTGRPGSFARLLQAVKGARIEGYPPVEIAARDLLLPIEKQPQLRLLLTNVLNRPLTGELYLTLGELTLETPRQSLTLAPGETRGVLVRVVGGAANASNRYDLAARFDAGADGAATLAETLHANVIPRNTVAVDADLVEWNEFFPVSAAADPDGPRLSEFAYRPFQPFPSGTPGGQTVAYLAYDDSHFYFAARIADTTPCLGTPRFETRNDEAYFYPETVTAPDGKRLAWPAGVRRFSYRQAPDLPAGEGTDNVQIAFNVLPAPQKRWLPYPPGTLPRFMVYEDTDYEFALNEVAPAQGGGTEIWCLQRPGRGRRHFYPRAPRAAGDGGPVKEGRLAMRRDGDTRIVECALPWSQIPQVQAAMRANQPIKFSYRINDNGGPAYELAAGRSVSKDNPRAFHNDGATHWANEIEFGWGR